MPLRFPSSRKFRKYLCLLISFAVVLSVLTSAGLTSAKSAFRKSAKVQEISVATPGAPEGVFAFGPRRRIGISTTPLSKQLAE
jgi:hypothetical protein